MALTFGLLSPNKGIEHMLRAMPEILEEFPNFVYIVLGATHPNLVREQGERYRLEPGAAGPGPGDQASNVIFYNRFVELERADRVHRGGGHLRHALPEPGADHLGHAGLLVRLRQGDRLDAVLARRGAAGRRPRRARAVRRLDGAWRARSCGLLRDEPRRHAMREAGLPAGPRDDLEPRRRSCYMESFQRARRGRQDAAVQAAGGAHPGRAAGRAARLAARPPGADDRLDRACSSTPRYTIPNFAEGYCTDDNARALLLTVLLEELGQDGPQVHRLATTYAAFLQARSTASPRRFRNFLGFDRRWLEEVGSDDCHGRALWALGACVGRSRRRDLPVLGRRSSSSRPCRRSSRRPRPAAWAFGLLGIHEYLRRLRRRPARPARSATTLTARLIELYRPNGRRPTGPGSRTSLSLRQRPAAARPDRQPADRAATPRALEVGLAGAALAGRQSRRRRQGTSGRSAPTASTARGGERAQFDQQPIEAHATVSACLEAYRATEDPAWLQRGPRRPSSGSSAATTWAWTSTTPSTGGCCDGLQEDRVNQNQGAESTLAFLLSLAEMNLLESSLAAFRQAQVTESCGGRTLG